MRVIKNWITRHPVTAFFVLTYGISWPLFAVTRFLFPGNMAVQGTLGTIAVFGPVLAGMIVSFVSDTRPEHLQGLKRPAVFFLAWLLSLLVLVFFIQQVRGARINAGIVILSGVLALLPAYVLSGAFSKRAGIRQYLGSLVRPRGRFVWYLVAFFTFPVIQLTGYGVTRMLGQDTGELIRGGFGTHTLIIIVLTFLYGFFFAGGINEESGWRGFAIPRLQKKLSPLAASVIVWFFWALWHLLYDISTGGSVSGILLNRLVYNLLWAVLFVWVFNRTRGSILAPAIFHPAMNTFGEILPRTDAATFLFAALTLYAVVSDRMWIKLSDDHSSFRQAERVF